MYRKIMCLAAVLMLIAVTTSEARPKLELRVGGGLRFGGSFSEGAYHRTDYPNDFQDDVYFEQLDIAPGTQFAVNFYVPLRPPGQNGEGLKFELFLNMATQDLRFDPQSQFPDSVSEQFEQDGDKLVLGEVDVMYVHGGVVYQFGRKAGWNPHVNLGLGATMFSATEGDFEETKFSMSLGGGVTRMFNQTFGTRLQLRGYFTALPAEEYWVDRYGWVWEVQDTNLFFQGELSGGIVIAF